MKMLKKIGMTLMAAAFVLITAVAAHAYTYAHTYEYGQPRIGAYYSVSGYAQGMYDYVSPPVALTRYGADYHIDNIRLAAYPNYPTTYLPTMQRPYFGYPYGFGRTPTVSWNSYGGYGGAGGFHYNNYGSW